MGIYSTYAAWVAGVKDWLDADHLTDEQIGTFIALGQERLNRELAVWEMERTETTAAASGTVPLPTDFNRIRQVSIAGQGIYEASTKGQILEAQVANDQTRPLFALDAGAIIIWPTPSDGAEVTIDYYTKVEPIGPTLDTNIFTENYSNLLLFASMAEGSVFIVEDDRAQGFEQKYMINLENANNIPKRVKMGSTPLRRFVRAI